MTCIVTLQNWLYLAQYWFQRFAINNQLIVLAFKDLLAHVERQDGRCSQLSYNHCFQTFSGEINHFKRLFYKLYLQHLSMRLCRHRCFLFHPLIFHNMNSFNLNLTWKGFLHWYSEKVTLNNKFRSHLLSTEQGKQYQVSNLHFFANKYYILCYLGTRLFFFVVKM